MSKKLGRLFALSALLGLALPLQAVAECARCKYDNVLGWVACVPVSEGEGGFLSCYDGPGTYDCFDGGESCCWC
jgi:hypothetical protein